MAKFLSYSYIPFSVIDNKSGKVMGEIFRPMVTIKLSYEDTSSTLPFDALVDSGSDRNLFPAYIAIGLGIDINSIKSTIVHGIGGVQIKVHRTKVSLLIMGEKFMTEADFSYDQDDAVLGRWGFFNLFKSVTFKEKERFTEIMLH